MSTDPNQRLVICILGTGFLLGVLALGLTSYHGAPIDVSVYGLVSAIGGAFINYLRPNPTPPPPGTAEVKTTTTVVPPEPPKP